MHLIIQKDGVAYADIGSSRK